MTRMFLLLLLCTLPLSADDLELEFTYEHRLTPQPEKGQPPAEPVVRTGTESVRLGKQYVCVTRADQKRVYHFGTRRTYQLQAKAKRHTPGWLYAQVSFREAELANRLQLKEVLGAGGLKGKRNPLNRFETETVLGMEASPPADFGLTEKVEGGLRSFLVGQRVVVQVTEGSTPLPPDRRALFEKYLLYNSSVHPQIRRRLARLAHLPTRLVLHYGRPGARIRLTLVLKQSKREAERPYRLPEGYARSAVSNKLLAKLLSRIPEKDEALERPTERAAGGFAKQAAADGRLLDAVLAVIEIGLHNGKREFGGKWIRAHLEQVKADAPCQQFFGALNVRSAEQARQALKRLAGIDRSRLKKGYVIDLMAANFSGGLGQTDKAIQLFSGALTHNPYLTNAWKDLGALYLRQYRMDLAWACFDVARRLEPEHPACAWIDRFEKRLVSQHPQYFELGK